MMFVMFSFALSALFYLSGITTDNETSTINIIRELSNGNSSTMGIGEGTGTNDVTNSQIYGWILATFAVAVAAGAAAVLFGNAGFAKVTASVLLSAFMVNFINDMLFVISKAGQTCAVGTVCFEWTYWIVWTIFIIITGGFIWSLVDFVLGTD